MNPFHDPLEDGRYTDNRVPKAKGQLSTRQVYVLREIAHGKSLAQIAQGVLRSESAINSVRDAALRTLGVKTSAHAIYIACKKGIL